LFTSAAYTNQPACLRDTPPPRVPLPAGALLDSAGRLVGMPVVSYSAQGSFRSSGVNFALPADLLRSVVPQLIVYKSAAVRR